MLEPQGVLTCLLLAYYWSGFEMVGFHRLSCERENYHLFNGIPFYKKVFRSLIWPYLAVIRKEFGWFFTCFIVYGVVFTFLYLLLINFVTYWAVILTILIFRMPLISISVNIPCLILATLLFLPLSKVFGWKVPLGMGRLS